MPLKKVTKQTKGKSEKTLVLCRKNPASEEKGGRPGAHQERRMYARGELFSVAPSTPGESNEKGKKNQG